MDEHERLALRNRREATGWSQQRLAAAIGVREETFRCWETGRATPLRVSKAAWLRCLEAAEVAVA